MANYLVASGSRKISQLEIATNPVPAGSSSVMPLVIGDTIPITNGTTVQITPDNFLSNLVFDANETYTGDNTFSGLNTFTDFNTFSGNNVFSGVNLFTNNNSFSGSAESDIANTHTNVYDSVTYTSFIQGGKITMFNETVSDALRIRVDDGNGVQFEDFGGVDFGTFMEVQTGQGDVHLKRNTVISGSLTVKEIFYVFETASVLNSSGSSKVGDSIDDTHTFTGSIILTGSLVAAGDTLLDGVNLSVFSSSVQTESSSFAQRDTDLEFFSSSQYNADSSSFAVRSTDLEFFSSSQYNDDSSSFAIRNTDLEFFSSSQYNDDSSSFAVRNTDLEFFSSSQYNADSSSFSTRLTGLSTDSASFSERTSDLEFFSSSQYNNDSSSFAVRNTDLEFFSSSQYNSESSSFASRITQNVGDISLLSGSFLTASGSFSTRITDIESFSSSLDSTYATDDELTTVSQSFETDIDNLSGSFSTRVTNNETDISNLQTDSGSFSTRVTTNETDISNLQTDSGSFSARVTDQEGFSSSFDANVLEYNNSVGVVSSSQQIDADNVTNFDSNVLTYIDSIGVVSGSSQVVFNDTSFNPFISTSAAISASNHFIPTENEVFDLGTPTQRWRDLYLSGSTIDLGGLLIQRGADGNVQFIDGASQAPKTVTIDSITGSLDISGNVTASNATFNGSIGIGEDNPSRPIHITADTPAIRLEDSTGSDYAELVSVNGDLYIRADEGNTESSSTIRFQIDQSEYARLDDSGNMSIGDGGNGARNSRLLLQNAGSQGAPQLMLVDSGDSTKQGELRFDAGDLIYEYWNGSSRSESLRVNTSGNLAFPNGQGIDFGASAGGGSTSNLLDDYEEGTWTPTLGYTTNGTLSVGYAEQYGYYTKIGRQVTVVGVLVLNSFTKGTASGGTRINGLPFATANLTRNQAHAVLTSYATPTSTTAGAFPAAGTVPNGSYVEFGYFDNNGTGITVDPDADSQYFLTLTYFTS